jgi:hypothetical protein
MYRHLTSAELKNTLSHTSEHSFSFNIERMHGLQSIPISTEPHLYVERGVDGDQNHSQSFYNFHKTLTASVAEGSELNWRLQLIDHYSTSEERKLSIGYQGFEYLGYRLLTQIKDSLMDKDGKWAYTKAGHGEKIFKSLLTFDRYCMTNLEEAKKDTLVLIATWLSDIMVGCRSYAMTLGLPMENVTEVLLGTLFSGENTTFGKSAVKTILFGLESDQLDDIS